MTVQKTLLAAAVLFALAACQPEPGATVANAANADDPLLVQEDEDDRDEDYDDNDGDADGEEGDADPDEDDDDGEDPDDTDTVASSPAEATEQADEAADDALLDTREGGNPLVNSPIAPVDPIVQEEEGEPEDDDEGE